MVKILIAGDNPIGDGMWHFFNKDHDVSTFNVWSPEKEEEPTWFNYAIICESALSKKVSLTKKRNIQDMRCDTTLIEDAIQCNHAGLFIVASNVEPGTIDKIKQTTGKRIVHVCCEKEMFVFGGDSQDTKEAASLFSKIGGSKYRYIQTDAKTCELFKCIKETFSITQHYLVNQLKKTCESSNADFGQIRELWLTEMKIDLSEIKKPEQETMNAFIAYADALGLNVKPLMEIMNDQKS